jgi:hypothetical protein
MTPDDRAGADDPTKPLPVDPDIANDPGPTEPMVAAHMPVATVSTEPLDPVAGGPGTRPDRSRALMWGLIAAVLLLGVGVIVVLSFYLGNDRPTPALSPTPSTSLTVTPLPTEGPPVDVPETPEDEPDEPAPQPTTPPEPTEPPDPEPTETPPATAP